MRQGLKEVQISRMASCALRGRMSSAEKAVAIVGASFPDAIDCFGLDQKVLLLAERDGFRPPAAKPYYRPLQEPVLASHWDRLVQLNFDAKQACEIASLLVGARQEIRSRPMVGRALDGSIFTFAKKPNAEWIDKLKFCTNQAEGPIELAARLFQAIVYEHPFTDGNGRFSRALIYGALGSFGLISNPCLGLNGIFEIHRHTMALALQRCRSEDSLETLMEALTKMLEDSIKFINVLLARSCAALPLS